MQGLNPKAPPHTTSGGLSGKDLSDDNQSLFCSKLFSKLYPNTSPTINRVNDK
mgnify:CR=1 FL=1